MCQAQRISRSIQTNTNVLRNVIQIVKRKVCGNVVKRFKGKKQAVYMLRKSNELIMFASVRYLTLMNTLYKRRHYPVKKVRVYLHVVSVVI